jgi:multiple sugar transport system substrate-binding protein
VLKKEEVKPVKTKVPNLLFVVAMLVTMAAGCAPAATQSPAATNAPAGAATQVPVSGGQAPASTQAPAAATQAPAAAATQPPAAASGAAVTLEFQQWWEPELPAGSLRQLMDQFQTQNPNIKVTLLSNPFSTTQQQETAGAATGTMACVVGLDGAWVSNFVKQGAIANLTELMTSAGYDQSQLAAQVKENGSTYMIPVVNFVYPLFYNQDMFTKAGITTPPSTRTEFVADAKKLTSGNIYGWIIPLSLDVPNGIQNDMMSWVWASGGSMLKDGKPNLTNNPDVKSAAEFIKSLYDAKVITPGAFTLAEPDKVTNFTNGRVAMMIDSLAHINLIRKEVPNLKFGLAPIPAVDGFTGKRGMPYASWGIGIAQSCQNKPEAWKLVEYMLSESVNSQVATLANAFPGNTKSVPDFSKSDPLFKTAFDIYKAGYPANEFVGLPVADTLMRDFDTEFQKYLSGSETVDQLLNNSQAAWVKDFQ